MLCEFHKNLQFRQSPKEQGLITSDHIFDDGASLVGGTTPLTAPIAREENGEGN